MIECLLWSGCVNGTNRYWWIGVMQVMSSGLIGCERWYEAGGRSGLYGWQSCRTRAEVSGSLPRHAMWGSDGRVEWKERGAHRSLAAVKGNMKRIFVHPLSLFRSFFLCVFHIHCFPAFSSVTNWKKFLWLSVASISAQSVVDPPPGRLRLLSFFHCFLRMWGRPPVTSESLIWG